MQGSTARAGCCSLRNHDDRRLHSQGCASRRPGGRRPGMTVGGKDDRKSPGREARTLPRRFYKSVTVEAADAAHRVLLDGKTVHTPAKAMFAVPTRALAEALAAEWEAQREHV